MVDEHLHSTFQLQTGDHSIIVNSNGGGNVYVNNEQKVIVDLDSLEMASAGLSSWNTQINGLHFNRQETKKLLDWVEEKSDKADKRVSVLVGNAGMGKSVVMHDVLEELLKKNVPVLGIKMDQLNYHTTDELNAEVGLNGNISITEAFLSLNKEYPLSVLLIDQIDALSMSLSSDRSPLEIANKLVNKISHLPNVKIIISCRRFDLDYDYTLRQFSRFNTVYLNELPAEQVDETLNSLKVNPDTVNPWVKQFLAIPINLYLYSLINNQDLLMGETLTLQKLYDELWSRNVVRSDEKGIQHEKVIEVLRGIVDKMYEQQSLMVLGKEFENQYSKELGYLLSSGFLTGNIQDGLQFLHQSLFDYTYARLFVESKQSLTNLLKDNHQGLFIRARVRSILLYQREDTSVYLRTLNELLFGITETGKPLARFHLKMLALNTIGLCENVSDEEKNYFKEHVLTDKIYGPIFLDSIYSRDWFNIITEDIDIADKISRQNKYIIEKMMDICWRIFSMDEELVDNYLDKLTTWKLQEINDAVFKFVNRIGRYAKNPDRLITLYKATETKKTTITYSDFLESVVGSHPEFVAEVLEKDLKNTLAVYTHSSPNNFKMGYEAKQVFDSLQREAPKVSFKVSLHAIHAIFDMAIIKYMNRDISSSWEFYLYNRGNEHMGSTGEDMLDFVLSYMEQLAVKAPQEADDELARLRPLTRNIDWLITLVSYTANTYYFRKAIYKIFTDTQTLAALDDDSVLEYYAIMLFAKSFMQYEKVQQGQILNTLRHTHPDWESMVIKGFNSVDYPMMRQGKSFGKHLNKLNQDSYLEANFHDIYLEYRKIKEKYGRLESEEPNKMEVHSGWVGMDRQAYDHMDDVQWLKSMKKYDNNQTWTDFYKPTLTGHAMQLKECAKKDPRRYSDLIVKAAQDENIQLTYPLYGFEGVTEAEDKEENREYVLKCFNAIKIRFDGDVNKNGSAQLCQILRPLKYFIEHGPMPQEVFNFICEAVINAKEDDDNNDPNDKEPYQKGLNRARGIAAGLLVDCSRYKEQYGEAIFNTLFSIAKNASIVTRAAIILNGAQLNKIDPDRSLDLYIELMYDCQPSLINIPLHNWNPVVYYINYGFDRLIPLYEEAIKKPACHQVLTETLWIAYVKEKDGAEQLLRKILKKSAFAATSFIRTVLRFYSSAPLSKSLNLLVMLMDMDNEETNKELNDIFDRHEYWIAKDIYDYAEEFMSHPCCQYVDRSFFNYLSALTKEKPKKALEWVLKINENNVDEQDDRNNTQQILQVLTQAYNCVRRYSPTDRLVEEAMDVMDKILEDPEKRQYLRGFINELDNR